MAKPSVEGVEIYKLKGVSLTQEPDLLVVEEPLEIRLGFGPEVDRQQKSISVTMRTPGQDLDLALGFLFTEGIVDHPEQIRRIEHCQQVKAAEEIGNVVKVELQPELKIDLDRLQRHFYTTSSCGVCGKASIEALGEVGCTVYPQDSVKVAADLIKTLPDKIRKGQTVFRHTGGIHATGLFDQHGNLEHLAEDVGRHNALDKVIGKAFYEKKLPLSNAIALCSGRLGFELVQKSLRAGIPILCAVGAPSSLAVKLAQEYGMTLIGFVRDGRFNIYTGAERILISHDLQP